MIVVLLQCDVLEDQFPAHGGRDVKCSRVLRLHLVISQLLQGPQSRCVARLQVRILRTQQSSSGILEKEGADSARREDPKGARRQRVVEVSRVFGFHGWKLRPGSAEAKTGDAIPFAV